MSKARGKAALAALLLQGLLALQGAAAADLPEAARLSEQGGQHFTAGRYGDALAAIERAQALRLAAFGPEHPESIEGARQVAVVMEKMGRGEQALRELERLLAVSTRALGEGHPTTILLAGNVGATFVNQGRYAEALAINEKAYRRLREAHGERDPKTLGAQANYASNLMQLGRYSESISMLERNVELRAASQGASHPRTLNGLGQLAHAANAAGQLQKAESAARQCLQWGASLPDAQPDKLGCALQRAAALKRLSRYAEAITAFRAAYEAAKGQYGAAHWLTLSSQAGLATALESSGDYPEALRLKAVVLETRKASLGPRHPLVLTDAMEYTAALRKAGRVEESVSLSREVWETAKSTLGPDDVKTQVYLANYANALDEAGRTREALPLMLERLPAARLALGPSHPDVLTTMSSVAAYYARLGENRDALAGYEALFETARQALGPTHETTLRAQRNIAFVYEQMGRYREAADLYRHGLKLRRETFGEESLQGLDIATDLANVLQKMDRLDDALALAGATYRTRARQLGEDHMAVSLNMEQYALMLVRAGRFDEAVPLAAKVAELRRKNLGEEHPQTLNALTSLGFAYSRSGRRAEAIASYERVLAIQVRVMGEAHPATLTTLNNLVLPYYYSGRKRDAAAAAKRGVAIAERLRREQILSPENRQAFLARWIDLYRNNAILSGDTTDFESSFQAAELLKARTLIESSLLRDAAAQLPEEALAGVKALEAEIATLNERIAATGGQAALRTMLEADKNRKLGEVEAKLKTTAGGRAGLAGVQPGAATAAQIQGELPPDTALLSFVLLEDRALVHIMTRERGVAQEPSPQAGLTDSVRAFRELLGRRSAAKDSRSQPVWKLENGSFTAAAVRPPKALAETNDSGEVAAFLGARLLAPLYPLIADKKRWIIAPDGELALIPLDLLRVEGQLVLARHDVSIIPAVSLYPLLARREREYASLTGRKTLLAMGGADYRSHEVRAKGVSPRPTYTVEEIAKLIKLRTGPEGDETARGYGLLGARWLALPGSEREVDEVAALFPASEVSVFKREHATETQLRMLNDSGELQKYRFLHFAAHGYLSTEEPALSSLVLGATAGADGYVTAADWSRYRLKSDLVVLSACNTGIGRLVRGEGVVGLPYALFVAGARNTLLTLWPVHDAATAEFVTRFFGYVRQGMPQTAALAETKRVFMKHSRYSAPEYWAPFVLYGS